MNLSGLPQNFGQIVLMLIVVGGLIAILYVASTAFGVAIPSWLITVFWICVCVCVLCAAVKFVIGQG